MSFSMNFHPLGGGGEEQLVFHVKLIFILQK
jgi:hypothetical protein